MDEKKQDAYPVDEAAVLTDDQLNEVDGGVGGGVSADQISEAVGKYRCSKDNGKLTHHEKSEIRFPLILRRTYWWTCDVCGTQYKPYDSSLTKVG